MVVVSRTFVAGGEDGRVGRCDGLGWMVEDG